MDLSGSRPLHPQLARAANSCVVTRDLSQPGSQFAIGACVGLLAWNFGASVASLFAILALPVAWARTVNRSSAAWLMAGYFLISSAGAIPGIPVFFGQPAALWMGVAAWLAFCVAATLPFALLWTSNVLWRPWQFVGAIAVLTLPPFGVIGMLNPIAVAGALFPWLSWYGLLLTFALLLVLGYRNVRWTIIMACMAFVSNGLALLGTPVPPSGWKGIDTHFSGLSSTSNRDAGQILAAMDRVHWVNRLATTIPPNSVVVLPETVLGSLDGVTRAMLASTESQLRAQGSYILVGAELPQPDGRYHNAVVALGAPIDQPVSALQTVPVPFAMWKPWASEGAIATPWDNRPKHIRIKGVDVAVSVCYEQLLPFALIAAMVDEPKVLVAVSNVWWAGGTTVPRIQKRTTDAITRLFGIAKVRADNF